MHLLDRIFRALRGIKGGRALVGLAAMCLVLATSAIAFAQSATVAPGPVASLNMYTVVTTLISLGIAVLTIAYNTGKLGGETVPQPALPWVGLGLSVLVAVGGAFGQAGAITAVSGFNAFVAAFFAAAANGSVMGAHAHSSMAKSAAQSAAKVGAVLLLIGGLGFLGATQSGCSSSLAQTILNDIKTGLTNGTTLQELESVVEALLPASDAGDIQAVDTIIAEGIDILESTGVLTATPQVDAIKLAAQTKAAAEKKAGWTPSESTRKVLDALRTDPAARQAFAKALRGAFPEAF